MSSSFNWWEEDDNDEKVAVGGESQFSQQFGFSQPPGFRCEHCGGTDSYHDNTSGQDVCTSCFTQSQVNLTQEVDDDDINVLAARRGTALKAIRQSFGGDGRTQAQGKLPLEDLDKSKPLPTLDICLEAMSFVVLEAARLFAIQVLGLGTVEDRADYVETVKNLWTRYLCAWMQGANELGDRFPEWRFSFRDHFLSAPTRGLVMANLAYWSKKKVDEQKASTKIIKEEATEQMRPPDTKRPAPNSANRSAKKIKRVNTSIERLIMSIRDRSDYKQAALKIEPSMDLVLAFLWLACSKSGITSFQACHWMSQSPLLKAFELLPAYLQQNVSLIQPFFSAPCAPRPRTLEETATLLAAACRMKTDGNWSYANGEVLFYSPKAVPIMIARMVTNAGLDQVVLRRSLGLLGLEENGTAPLPGVSLDDFSRNEDFLAVIAIACILDPGWTSWSFRLSRKVNIPLNECHFAYLTNADVDKYLDFLDRQNLFAKSRLWDGFSNLSGLAYQKNDSDGDGEEEPTRPHPIVSDLENMADDKEAKLHVLLGFLAYSVQGEVSRIRSKLATLLESKRKSGSTATTVSTKHKKTKKAP